MSDVRCRACGAALPAAAQWCSLCYADLREPAAPEPARTAPVASAVPLPVAEPATVREPVTVPATQAATPATSPAASHAASAVVPPAVVTTQQPTAGTPAAAAVATEPTWPCPSCGDPVPISLDACITCGAGFLSGATTVASARLPLVGDVGRMTQGQRMMIGAGVAVVVMVVLVVLATLGAKVF